MHVYVCILNRKIDNGIDIENLRSQNKKYEVSKCLSARNREESYLNEPELKPLGPCRE